MGQFLCSRKNLYFRTDILYIINTLQPPKFNFLTWEKGFLFQIITFLRWQLKANMIYLKLSDKGHVLKLMHILGHFPFLY
jgi:hypothetical protein